MPKHWVRQHDCLSSIARQHGLRNERAIRDHAPNASLRQERPNPNVLRPGDTVDLPELEPRIASADTGSIGSRWEWHWFGPRGAIIADTDIAE